MLRRTLLQTTLLGFVTTLLPKQVFACACGGSARYIKIDSGSVQTGLNIDALLDQHYGRGNWQWHDTLPVTVNTPDIAENQSVVNIKATLNAVPEGYRRYLRMDYFTHGVLPLADRETERADRLPVSLKLAGTTLANVSPVSFTVRYRRLLGTSKIYIAVTLENNSGEPKVLVYKHPPALRAGTCGWTIYIDPNYIRLPYSKHSVNGS